MTLFDDSPQWTYDYAVARTGVQMPNCFTWATCRITWLVGYQQPLDPDNNRVAGAQDLWNTHHANFTQSSTPQKGALMIWSYGTWGHVAVCENDDATWWSQSNYGGAFYEDIKGVSPYGYCGMTFLGYLIHKDLKKSSSTSKVVQKSNMEEEDWGIKWTNDTPITIHKDNSSGTAWGTWTKGETLHYTHKGVGNGHRWVGWTEGSQFYVCAISGSETRGEDMWCELCDPATFEKNAATTATTTTNTATSATVTKSYEEALDDPEQPDLAPETLESQHSLTINVSLVDKSHWRSKCPYVMTPEYVVIHNAATPNGTAKSLCNYQNKEATCDNDLKSWHFSVDENEIWESLPLNRNGFHASDGADGDGNRKGIAIEIARDNDGEEAYYEAAENNGAKLAAVLLNKYGWDTSHLKTHHDFAKDGKWCPHKILDNGWDLFVAKVQSYLDEIQGKSSQATTTATEATTPTTEVTETKSENVTNELVEEQKKTNSLIQIIIDLIKKIFNIK